MRNQIIKIVNGKPEEADAISSLLSVGFLTGIFIATFDVGAITLFLQYFDEKTDVPRAFVLSGILGLILTFTFSKLQGIIAYRKLVKGTVLTFAILVCILSTAINITAHKYLIFLAYVFFPPLNAMVVLIFWGVFGRVFNFRSAKRLASGIDTGQVVATILAFFTIPFFQKYLISDTKQFLYVSSVSMVIGTIIYWQIFNKFSIQETPKEDSKTVDKKTKTFYRKFIWLLSGFVICSALAAAFVEYSFLTVTAEKFDVTKDTQNLTSFISFFSGTVMICSFLIQTFLNDKILEMYGIRNTLLLLPALLFVFGIISTIIGLVFGITSESITFLFFFLIIATSKLFCDALRDSLESPVFKNFFFPIEASIRFSAQSSIEGMVREGAAFLAGLLMMAAGLLYFYDVIFNNYILFGIIAIWCFITIMLYGEYNRILTFTLQKNKADILDKHDTDYLNVLLTTSLSTEKQSQVYAVLKLTERLKPYLLELNMSFFAKQERIESKEIYLEFIKNNLIINMQPFIDSVSELSKSNVEVSLLNETTTYLNEAQNKATEYILLAHMASSKNVVDRQQAAILIRYHYNQESFNLLLTLLRDFDLQTKREAIITAGTHQVKELLPIIIEYLADADLTIASAEALSKYGEDALQTLDIAFYKNNQLTEVRLEIIELLGIIKGEKAIKMLLKKIDYPDHRILLAIFNALKRCGWSGVGFDIIFVKNALNTLAGTLLWNLVSLHDISDKEAFKEVKSALKYEIVENKKMIFSLLSLLYEKRSIDLVQENIRLGTSESIGFAIELLNIILEDDLKPYIIPLLDDSPIQEKYRKLEVYFPRGKMDDYELMLELLNRDYNWTNRWTKVCALKILAQYSDLKIDSAIAANIFNPDPIIRELTAEIIYKKDKAYYQNLISRTNSELHSYHPSSSKTDLRNTYQLLEKLQETTFFENFPSLVLSEIAEFTQVEYYAAGEIIFTPGNFQDVPTFLLIKGIITVSEENSADWYLEGNTIISDLKISHKNILKQTLTAKSQVIILNIHTEKLYQLLKLNRDIIQILIKNLQKISSNYRDESAVIKSNI